MNKYACEYLRLRRKFKELLPKEHEYLNIRELTKITESIGFYTAIAALDFANKKMSSAAFTKINRKLHEIKSYVELLIYSELYGNGEQET